MTDDDELRQRVVDAAAELFTEHGYHGTKVEMVAKRAGVTPRVVRRLTGGRAELFRLVMVSKVSSSVAERLAAAASDPSAAPPLSVLLAAGEELFTDPVGSWQVLELEALTQAHRDGPLREVETERMRSRRENTAALVEQVRAGGGLDPDLDAKAVVHLIMALSAGMALLDPATSDRPSLESWMELMARLTSAMGPAELPLNADFRAGIPWRVRVDVVDRPGELPGLTRALAGLHVYTVGLYVVGAGDGRRTVDLFVTAPISVTRDQIAAAVGSGGRSVHVRPGAYDDDNDLPTRVLDGATRLVRNPGWAPVGARILAQADRVEVVSATEGVDAGADVLRLQWTSTLHVLLHRTGAPFVRAERTRASALLRLSAEIAALRGDENALGWLQPIAEGTVLIRLAQPGDADAVAEMHERCSQRSRYLRYVSLGQWRDVQLQRLSGGHRGATLVGVSYRGEVVALGNVFPEHDGDERSAEIALLVEDAYQGRGLGRAMLARQIELARTMGFREVVGVVLAENTGMLKLLESSGLPWTSSIESGVATWRAALEQPGAEPEPDHPSESTPGSNP